MTLSGHVAWNMSLAALAGSLAAAPELGRGKRELYGDPALVPTRAGERAREELALAGAVAAGVRALGGEPLHVEVRLPRAGDAGALVVIAREVPGGPGEAELRALVGDLCGPWSLAATRLHLRPEAPPEAPPRGRWPLHGALVGLGASLGIAFDRARRRR